MGINVPSFVIFFEFLKDGLKSKALSPLYFVARNFDG